MKFAKKWTELEKSQPEWYRAELISMGFIHLCMHISHQINDNQVIICRSCIQQGAICTRHSSPCFG